MTWCYRVLLVILMAFSLKAESSCFYSVDINPSQVYDGDTIQDVVFNMDFGLTVTRTVRLFGIDAPEIRGGTYDQKQKGKLAKKKLAGIVAKCKHIRLLLRGDDSFGRSLADIFCGNVKVNDFLVRRGYAKPYFP